MTRVDARLVLPGQWLLIGEGSPFPRALVGTAHRVHHVEVLPADRRDIEPPGPTHEVALCLLQRGAHPGHTAEDARRGEGQVHPVRPGSPADGAVMPEPWPILWLPVGSFVDVVEPPPRPRVVWQPANGLARGRWAVLVDDVEVWYRPEADQ